MKSKYALLSTLVICTAGIQASDGFKYPEDSKKGIYERDIRRNQLEMQKITELINALTQFQKDDESLFENSPHDYFGGVSYEAEKLVNLYRSYAPIDEHVEAIELYALMFKAFANAAKGKDDYDHELLNKAHSKVPDLIRLAEYLMDHCRSVIEEDTTEMNS